MLILHKPFVEHLRVCSYLQDKCASLTYFVARNLDEHELAFFLNRGWRKFGPYYFRPACPECQDCVPLRVLARQFTPSKSQRRLLRKNSETEVRFQPLHATAEIFAIYQEHTYERFQRVVTWREFVENFYTPSCRAFQSEYYIQEELAAVGFLDRAEAGLSSVYFFYRTKYNHLSLGNYSILKEIEYAAWLGLPYYYLGYYIAKDHSMAYKSLFHPYETYDWHTQIWCREDEQAKTPEDAEDRE
jgi:arginine-tRNA-protein transferase